MNETDVVVLFSNMLLMFSNIWNGLLMVTQSPQIFPESTTANVRQSWSLINSDVEAVGSGILLKIFEKHPEYQEKFRTLKSTPISEMRNNQEFVMHSGRVGRALQTVVETLDKPDTLIMTLTDLGKRHVKYEVFGEHLLNSEPIILQFLAESLKEHATKEVLEAWKNVLHVGIETMIKGQKDG